MARSSLPPPTFARPPEPAMTGTPGLASLRVPNVQISESPENEEIKRKAERGAKLSSLVVTVMVHVVLILILTLIILPGQMVDVPEIHAKTIEDLSEQKIQQTPRQTTVRSKPAAASSSARLLTSQATTSTVFHPEVNTETPITNMGMGTGVGLGLGFGDSGTGTGGKVGFFGQTTTARRVAFVIDYSLSMKGQRDPMMREELTKSIKELKPGISYSLIFFAGPVWFAGEEIKNVGGNNRAIVDGQDGETYEWVSVQGATNWKLNSGKLPQVKWIDASASNVRKSLKHIQESRLVYGTDWDDPLEIALDANPKPDVIYFMTDGIAGNRSMETALAIAKRANSGSSKVTINCISMMEPKALEPMKVMAEKTGGQMTVINADGSRTVVIGPKR